ncbi:hypothetical protein BH09VER1_BH09VER1_44070 [soil metagenome]
MPAAKRTPKKEPTISDEEREVWAQLQDVACPVILVPVANLTAKAIKNLPDVLGVRELTILEGTVRAFAIPIQYMDDGRIALLRAGKKIPY